MYPIIETHPLISMRLSATVDEAARLMDDCGMGAIGVLDADRKFVGIFTERDLTHFVARSQNAAEVRMAEVVNDFPVVVEGPVTFAAAAAQMETSHVRHLIVREGDDYKIVSMRDLIGAGPEEEVGSLETQSEEPSRSLGYLAAFAPPLPMRAQDIMTATPVAVREDARLEEVAEILSDRSVSGLPVVDDEERVVGVISERDVARVLGNTLVRLAIRRGGPHATLPRRGFEARQAGEAMSRPAITVRLDTPVTTIAEILFKEEINRVPVVNADRLVGVVTRGDVLGAFAGLPHQSGRGNGEAVPRRPGPSALREGAGRL